MKNLIRNKSLSFFMVALLLMALMLPLQQAKSQENSLVTIIANGSFNDVVAKLKRMVA